MGTLQPVWYTGNRLAIVYESLANIANRKENIPAEQLEEIISIFLSIENCKSNFKQGLRQI